MNDSKPYLGPRTANLLKKTRHNAAGFGQFFFSIWSYRVIRILLCVVFFWSGMTKLIDPQSFAIIIGAYGLTPESWTMPLAVILPAIEVIAALGLLADIEGSLAVISALLLLFMVILGYGIWMGLDVDCGCFGPEDPEAKAYHGLRPALYRDMIMLAGVSYLYILRYRQSLEPLRWPKLFRNQY